MVTRSRENVPEDVTRGFIVSPVLGYMLLPPAPERKVARLSGSLFFSNRTECNVRRERCVRNQKERGPFCLSASRFWYSDLVSDSLGLYFSLHGNYAQRRGGRKEEEDEV